MLKKKLEQFILRLYLVQTQKWIDYFKNLNYLHVDIEDMQLQRVIELSLEQDNRGSTIIIENKYKQIGFH
jgi:hypothetical protein